MPSRYSIKDLERISGIKAHTIRIWEQRYGILQPERTPTNIRYYSDADLKRVLNISLLNNKGYKISNIARYSEDMLMKEVEKLLATTDNENNYIESLMMCTVDMDEPRFEKIMQEGIKLYGYEDFYEKVIFPFLNHLGNMWQADIISPAREHFISNLIRRKLIAGTELLPLVKTLDVKTYIFFLPENEQHEIGLIYAFYLCRSRGHRCFYIGQGGPPRDLECIVSQTGADYVVTVLTSGLNYDDPGAFLMSLEQNIPGAEFLLSGRLFYEGDAISLPSERFKLFRDFSGFKSCI